MSMTNLEQLFAQGQSPWLDNLSRGMISNGTLAIYLSQGIRGVTSNPTIFQKSIETDTAYDTELAQLKAAGTTADDAYWKLVKADIASALTVLRPVYDANPRLGDGCVSLEVSPRLAADTAGTVEMGTQLWTELAQPNLMVKVPATPAGVPAIRTLIAAGVNVNVTLIFSLGRYAEVVEAYMAGLEAREGDLSSIVSVASFFISRTDTEIDKRLDAVAAPAELHGKAAVAQAQLAYELFTQAFSGPRWEALVARGANAQRPLWASTSTKNPAYDDLLYVEPLVLPQTVNTMPDATITAVLDHAEIASPDLETVFTAAHETFSAVGAVGIDYVDVAATLEREGVEKFGVSFDDVLKAIAAKL